ncbi:MAG TPA: acetylornithine deacetylase [Acidimicrobiia bacterium]|nr:acetylornithine deacetylase [Acidimicrobiia bacterium]
MLDRTVDILSRLVSFPTVSTDSNLDLIDYATDLLAAVGARVAVTTDPPGNKANVFATIGPEVEGGVILSGHTDVVPVEGQEWTRPPFTASVTEGRVWGRGTTDMKGFIACMLAIAPRFAASSLTRPLHLAMTYDEEEGCNGAKVMLEALKSDGTLPAVAIIGEPTGLGIVVAHKGCYEFTTEIHGVERHASMSAAGAGAIHAAARFIGMLDGLSDELAERAPADSPFEPPASTINVGTISGGVARNITAGSAVFDWEIRPVEADDVAYVLERANRFVDEVLLPRMRREYPEATVTTTTVGAVGGFRRDPDGQALALARRLTGNTEMEVVSFGTEAGLFQEIGIAPVVCGPGSIEQAHKPDEFIELTQLQACLTMLERLIPELQ